MTLLFVDGFDHYATADLLTKWTSKSTNSAIGASGGRRSSGAYVPTSFHYLSKTLSSSSASIVCGMAYKPAVLNAYALFGLYEGSTGHLTVTVETNGKLTLRRGIHSGTILATSTTVLAIGTWYYVELKATINDTTGSYELRINGVTDFSASNTDTRNGGTTGLIDTFTLGQISSTNGNQGSYDDLYVCNTSGSTNNNFLGDCRIDTLYPTADGNYSQFTPSTGTTHYTLVDETSPNTTDYVSDATSGDRDSYAYQDLASLTSQTIYGVQINAYATASDAGARSLGTMSRLSSTDKDGAGKALSNASWTYVSEIQETDPSSAAWTQTNVNAAEFGVKVTA